MDHNQDREATLRENQARTRVLSKEVRHLQEEKSKQVSGATADQSRGLTLPWLHGQGTPSPAVPWPPFFPPALDPLQAADTQVRWGLLV